MRFHHQKDIVFRLDDRSASRKDEKPVSADEVDQDILGKVKVFDRLSGSGRVFRNEKLVHAAGGEAGLFEFQRCAGFCSCRFVQIQPLGELHERFALDEYGTNDDEKDEIEDLDGIGEQFRIFMETQAWKDREDDRCGTADPAP